MAVGIAYAQVDDLDIASGEGNGQLIHRDICAQNPAAERSHRKVKQMIYKEQGNA